MDFEQLTKVRQSCRSYDADRPVEEEKIAKLVEAAKVAPSAMNAQPYDVWVVRSPEKVQAIRDAKSSFNGFIDNVNLFIVFTDAPYSNGKLEGLAGEMQIDYRTQDIGESIAYLTLQAKDLGLDTCILGGFRIDQVKKALGTDAHIQIIVAVGYATEGYKVRSKVRKADSENVRFV